MGVKTTIARLIRLRATAGNDGGDDMVQVLGPEDNTRDIGAARAARRGAYMFSNWSTRRLVLPLRISRSVLYLSRPWRTFSRWILSIAVSLVSSRDCARSCFSACGQRGGEWLRVWGRGPGGPGTHLELVVQPLVALGQRAALGHGVHEVVGRLGEVAAARVAARVGRGVGVAAHVRGALHHVVVLRGGGRRQRRRRLVLGTPTPLLVCTSYCIIGKNKYRTSPKTQSSKAFDRVKVSL